MFGKKKKIKNICYGDLIMPSIMRALAFYFVVFGVRSHLT